MPPKKLTQKAIEAAEKKKENTRKAKSILDQLREELSESESERLIVKKPMKKSGKDKSAKSYKKPNDLVAEPKQASLKNVSAISCTVTSSSGGGSNSTATSSGDVLENGEIPGEVDELSNRSISGQAKSIEIGKPKPYESATRKSTGNHGNKFVAVSKAGSSRSSHGFAYQYQIHCENVADSIDVNDLKVHLETHLKIDGEKGNLGTVSIVCEGQKVVINSKTFFPKKSLRFLSKKFLKKNWNIRVVSKNVHSYEYKYVGQL